MREITLSDLVSETKKAMLPFGFQGSTYYRFDVEFRAINSYFTDNNLQYYTSQVSSQYVEGIAHKQRKGEISLGKLRRARRAVSFLNQCHEQGHITWGRLPSLNRKEQPQMICAGIKEDYIVYLKHQERSSATIKNYTNICSRFLAFITAEGHRDLSALALKDVSMFITHMSKWYQPSSMGAVLTGLRSLFSYLKEMQYDVIDMIPALPVKSATKTIVSPALTDQEEQKLLTAIDRNTKVGKRDYAIVLLALRTGLRSVDIIKLSTESMDWSKNTIALTQSKTNRLLILPLLSDVRDAIADYLLHGRPDCDSRHLFIRYQAPYVGLSDGYSCSNIVKRAMKRAGIRQNKDDRNGAHCLRYSLATRLLQAETPLSVISSVLGHRQKDSAKEYLSIDTDNLRVCALDLTDIEVAKEELQL